MSELRHNRLDDLWHLVAPVRGKRPGHRPPVTPGKGGCEAELPILDPTCPFCPGNEARLASVPLSFPAGQDNAPGPGWQIRVVDNKYPAVTAPAGPVAPPARPGYGYHEVLVEGPRHNASLASHPPELVATLLTTLAERCRHHLLDRRIQSVIPFGNHGGIAGASQLHPHSQLAALPYRPPLQQRREASARRYLRRHGRCLLCDELTGELAQRANPATRILHAGQYWITLVPYAPATPGECWLVPRRHLAALPDLDDAEIAEVARLLPALAVAVKATQGDPPWNLLYLTASRREAQKPAWHLHLRLVPRTTIAGGFELATGSQILPACPEESAAELRAALAAGLG